MEPPCSDARSRIRESLAIVDQFIEFLRASQVGFAEVQALKTGMVDEVDRLQVAVQRLAECLSDCPLSSQVNSSQCRSSIERAQSTLLRAVQILHTLRQGKVKAKERLLLENALLGIRRDVGEVYAFLEEQAQKQDRSNIQ